VFGYFYYRYGFNMLEKIFELESSIPVPQRDSYIESYPYLCSHFSSKAVIDPQDVVLGAHMVYGWMPTVLGLDTGAVRGFSLQQAADLLTVSKGRDLDRDELSSLKGLINNSIVGASKLLHFVEPTRYPIWDSRIYRFCYGKKGHAHQVNNVDAYLSYRSALMALMSHSHFPQFHASVNAKVGYSVSGPRALELMMFLATRPVDGQ
jgi:hypothetical protein